MGHGGAVNTAAQIVVVAAGVVALIDWWAVARGAARLEAVAKPAVMVLLIVAVAVADPGDAGAAVALVVALSFSLIADVALLPQVDRFVEGLAGFLVAHLAYLVALGLAFELRPLTALVAAAVLAGAVVGLGVRIVGGARRADPRLTVPVAGYVVVLTLMAVTAIATHSPLAAVGGLAFVASDSILGWNRFVEPLAWSRPAVMSTYHVAQFCLTVAVVAG